MDKVKSFCVDGDKIRVNYSLDGKASHIDYVKLSDFADVFGLTQTKVEHWVKSSHFGPLVPKVKYGRFVYFSFTILEVIKNMLEDGYKKEDIRHTLFKVLTQSVLVNPYGLSLNSYADLKLNDLLIKLDKSLLQPLDSTESQQEVVSAGVEEEDTQEPQQAKNSEATPISLDVDNFTGALMPESVEEKEQEPITKEYVDSQISKIKAEKDFEIKNLKSMFMQFANDVKRNLNGFKDTLKKNVPSLVNSLDKLQNDLDKTVSKVINVNPDINKWKKEILHTLEFISRELAYRDMVNHHGISVEVVNLLKDKNQRSSISDFVKNLEKETLKTRYQWLLKNLLEYCEEKSISEMSVISLVKSQKYLSSVRSDNSITNVISHFNKLPQDVKTKCLVAAYGDSWEDYVQKAFKEGVPKPKYSLLNIKSKA